MGSKMAGDPRRELTRGHSCMHQRSCTGSKMEQQRTSLPMGCDGKHPAQKVTVKWSKALVSAQSVQSKRGGEDAMVLPHSQDLVTSPPGQGPAALGDGTVANAHSRARLTLAQQEHMDQALP